MPYKIVLSTETTDYKSNLFEINNIHPSNINCTWTERMAEAVEQIDSDYIIFMLDDFFLYDFVQEEKIEECIEYLKSNPKIATFTFFPIYMQSEPSKYEGYNKREKNSRNKISATIGIWNKKILQKYLCGYKENIWEWEQNATHRSNTLYPKDEFYTMKLNTKEIFPYNFSKYGLFSGKWLTPTKELFEELNIKMDFSKRGFYNEALRGLEKSIIPSFKLDSAVIPYYELTHKKSPYLKCNQKPKSGKFRQEYNISGARNIIRWEPSYYWGFGIKNLKISIVYKDKMKEIIEPSALFGAFIRDKETYIFNKPNPYMLIPTIENKIISKLIIEGKIEIPLTEEILEKSYNKETLTDNTKHIEFSEKIWNEFFVIKEKMYHVSFEPQAYLLSKNGSERKNIEGKYKIRKKSFINYFPIEDNYDSMVWTANKNPGYAIKNLKILLHMKNNTYKWLSKGNLKEKPFKIRNEYIFLQTTSIIQFNIPYKDIDEVRILGKFICPVKSKKVRKIIYGK